MTAQTGAASSSCHGINSRLPAEAESASDAAIAIANASELDDGLVVVGPESQPVEIAPALGELIIELLGYVSTGNMVALVPLGAKLTVQQAADMLNVPCPHLIELLKRGDIDCEEFGSRRLVPLSAIIRYREERERKQEEAMSELSRLGQDFDLA